MSRCRAPSRDRRRRRRLPAPAAAARGRESRAAERAGRSSFARPPPSAGSPARGRTRRGSAGRCRRTSADAAGHRRGFRRSRRWCAGCVMIVRTFSSLPMWATHETPSSSSTRSSQTKSIGRAPASAAASAMLRPIQRSFSRRRALPMTTIVQSIGISGTRPIPAPPARPAAARAGHPAAAERASRPSPSCIQLGRNAQIGGAGEVRVRVERDVEPLAAGAVDQLEELRRPAAVDLVAEVRVRQMERDARAAGDLEAVRVRL